MFRQFVHFLASIGWVVAALAFSAFSIAAVIGIAWLLREALPFMPDALSGLFFLLAFVIYIVAVVWIGWQILKRGAQIS
ncbi:MAG: hypothetical protein HY261_06950 [Chloroflexi bacterium]|nr:hypothetical protein [Chloroflexota bacterium]